MIDLGSVRVPLSLVPLVPFNWIVGCGGRLALIWEFWGEKAMFEYICTGQHLSHLVLTPVDFLSCPVPFLM